MLIKSHLDDIRFSKYLHFPEGVIKNEPMFFSSSADYCIRNGGDITKHILTEIKECDILTPDEYNSCIIDSRVHMLMPGWYPCIPATIMMM